MRLNNDCVRDILLSVEEVCDFNESFRYSKFSNDFERLQPYSHDEIIYHIKQCKLASLITSMFATDGGDYLEVGDLTPEGHKFLANIRNDDIWNKVKKIAGTVGSHSLSAITQISANVVTQLIKAQFGIT